MYIKKKDVPEVQLFTARIHLISGLAALILVACGSSDNSTSSKNGEDGSVQLYGAKVATSASNLPTCDSTQVGQLFYVLADETFQFCSAQGYQTIDLTGIAGTNGTNGSSCSVISNTNGSKTILCEDGTTATVSDGASCTVADNGDGSYDLTCSGTTVTVSNGVNGTDGTSCLASKSNDSLFVNCNGVLDTIVDGVNGTDGSSCTVSDDGAGTLTQTCTDGTSVSWINYGLCGTQAYNPGTHFCDSRDNHLYKFVTIGTQTWMAENLAYLPSVNANSDASASVAKYYVYNYDGTAIDDAKASSYYTTYGVLYNWTAAMAGAASSTESPSGVKGVCPTGWHLPSSAEWATLETTVGGASTAGTKLKSVSGWSTGGNAATDAYGFSALPGGYYYGSNFSSTLIYGYWWTATEGDASGAYGRYMIFSIADVYSFKYSKTFGFSVRCLQD